MNARKVKLWFIQDKPASRAYSKLPKARHPVASDIVYVPFSLIEHTQKFPPVDDEWPVHVVTLPEWFLEKEGL